LSVKSAYEYKGVGGQAIVSIYLWSIIGGCRTVKYVCGGVSRQFVIAINRRVFGQSVLLIHRWMADEAILIEGCQVSLCSQTGCQKTIKNFTHSNTVSEHSQKYKEASNLVIYMTIMKYRRKE
jgi:hypothetical protein